MAAGKPKKRNKRVLRFDGVHYAEIVGDRLRLPDELFNNIRSANEHCNTGSKSRGFSKRYPGKVPPYI